MTNHTRYQVVYKDSKTARTVYFGPFVSLSVAERALDDLPEPLEGGYKMYKSFQPYTHSEMSVAGKVILRKRTHGDLLDVIHEIAGVKPF